MTDHMLVLGGARSGKSRRALVRAESCDTHPVYIATAEPLDEEMKNRIAAHREERGEHWSTVEAPLLLTSALREHAGQGRVCVVDCLTIWLSNLMHHEKDPDEATNALCSTLADLDTPVILVSNEVGLGIVPESPLGRRFRDAQGRLNQRMAACCAHVEFMVAGLPMTLKGEPRV